MAPDRAWALWRLLGATAAAAGIAGCASAVDIRFLATGRANQPAYEMRGQDLAPLQREAQRLCPAGAEVLRQAVAGQARPADGASRVSRWLGQAGQWIDPPQRQAQLVVLCRAAPQDLLIVPQPAAAGPLAASPQDATSGAPAEAVAAAPIGPVMPAW